MRDPLHRYLKEQTQTIYQEIVYKYSQYCLRNPCFINVPKLVTTDNAAQTYFLRFHQFEFRQEVRYMQLLATE